MNDCEVPAGLLCCGNCRFWRPLIDPPVWGHCRRFPPTVDLVFVGDMLSKGRGDELCPQDAFGFPWTEDAEWCGEWQPKAAADPRQAGAVS